MYGAWETCICMVDVVHGEWESCIAWGTSCMVHVSRGYGRLGRRSAWDSYIYMGDVVEST